MCIISAPVGSMTVRNMPTNDRAVDPFARANMSTNGAGLAHGKTTARLGDQLCRCGCKLPHNFSVSRLVEDGGFRHVFWYRHIDHRNRHAGITR